MRYLFFNNENNEQIYYQRIVNHLNKLPSAYINENSDSCDNEICLLVMQGEGAIIKPTTQYRIISTFGFGTCHCLIIYNRSNKYGFLAHLDDLTELNSLNKIYDELEIEDISDVDIYIAGGDCNFNQTAKIYKKLELLNLHKRILGVSLHDRNIKRRISLDIYDGTTSYILPFNYRDAHVPDIILKFRELNKIC